MIDTQNEVGVTNGVKTGTENDAVNETWVEVGSTELLPDEATYLTELDGEPVCLYNVEGQIYATHDTCTHANVSLADGFICGDTIECPLHQGQFHIPTGRAVGMPCTIDLKTYETRVEAGVIFLKRV